VSRYRTDRRVRHGSNQGHQRGWGARLIVQGGVTHGLGRPGPEEKTRKRKFNQKDTNTLEGGKDVQPVPLGRLETSKGEGKILEAVPTF